MLQAGLLQHHQGHIYTRMSQSAGPAHPWWGSALLGQADAGKGQGGLAWSGDLGGPRARLEGQCPEPCDHIYSLLLLQAKPAPAASLLMSSGDIQLAGHSSDQQKERPSRCCSLAFPQRGPGEPARRRACRDPPLLCLSPRQIRSQPIWPPACQAWPGPGDPKGCQTYCRAAPCPHHAPEPGRSFWLSLIAPVPVGASRPKQGLHWQGFSCRFSGQPPGSRWSIASWLGRTWR